MDAFTWLIDFLEGLTGVWEWLTTPLANGFLKDLTTPISLFSLSGLAILIGIKAAQTVNPL